jgi:peptide/nickel transport system substrate-binding protein
MPRPRLRLFTALVLTLLVAAPALAQKPGGSLVIAQGVDAVTLDSHLVVDSPTFTVTSHVFETLFEYTPEGKIVPHLAESYGVSGDGLTWTLRLRKGVKFHDGTPLSAEAVKFNLERVLNPDTKSTYRFLIDRIKRIEVVDASTLRLGTEKPFAPMLAHLTHGAIAIQSPAAIRKHGKEYVNFPTGTGPFKLKEWVRGDRLVLAKNPDYWGKKPFVNELIFRPVPEGGARMALIETGAAHVIVRVPPRDAPRLTAKRDVEVINTPSVRTIYIAFNMLKPPFTDLRVRQALNHAVNKPAIVQHILAGVGRPSDAPISPGIFGYRPIMTYEYDPARARKLLAEAGHPNGFKTELYCPTGRYLNDIQVCEAVQAQLREVGVEAAIKTMEWAAYLDVTKKGAGESVVPMYMLGWGTVTGDADYGLYALFHSSQWTPAGQARNFYKNPRVDELLDRGRTVANPALREAAYREAMELIMKDAPWLFLHAESQLSAVRRNVKGVVIHPVERVMAEHAWIE